MLHHVMRIEIRKEELVLNKEMEIKKCYLIIQKNNALVNQVSKYSLVTTLVESKSYLTELALLPSAFINTFT